MRFISAGKEPAFSFESGETMKTNVFQTYDDLVRQAELLQEVSHDFDPTEVDLVQVAIAEDVLFFEMKNLAASCGVS